jgi:cyanophycin synthetase
VVEVNSGPGFRLHMEPAEGKPRNVAGAVIDMLFPEGSPSRIPIIAVTGTSKNMISCDLIEQLMITAGYRVGSATSRGVYIQNFIVHKGNATGYAHAELVLKDPTIDLAVLECAVAAIYSGGLAFLNCDMGIVIDTDTNGPEATRAAGVVPGCVLPSGYAILNADIESVYQMRQGLVCNIAFFSLNERNPRIIDHLRNGGHATFIESGYITYCHGLDKKRVIHLSDIPSVLYEKHPSLTVNVLAAILVGKIYRIDTGTIRETLLAFIVRC